MVTTSEAINSTPTEKPLAEKLVTLHSITWQAYEQILDALGHNQSTIITYYQGMLEIMTLLEEHETGSEHLGMLIQILTEELNLNIKNMASTTLKIPKSKIVAQPDKCYYIQNEPAVRGKTVNLAVELPPDLILKVDITHADINKKQLYQEMKVSEFWRYNGKKSTIYILHQESAISRTFPILTKTMVYEFLANCKTQGETQTKRVFRAMLQEQIQQ